MRILAITNQYPRPGRETAAAFNRQQFKALAAQHELRVVAPVPWTDHLQYDPLRALPPREYVNADGILVYHPTYYYLPRIMEYRYGQFYLHSIRKTVWRVLNAYRPDILLACWAHPDGWAAAQIARQVGLPVVLKVIGSDLLVVSKEPRRRRRIVETLQEVDGVVAVSQDLADHAIQLGADPTKVQLIYEGVNGELFHPGDQREAKARLGIAPAGKTLLFVGNLLWTKGVGVLAEACRRLLDRGKVFHGYLVGHGRNEAGLRALIGRLGLNGHLTLTGPQEQERLADWYRACDVVVLPSYSEGVPNVLREAMMSGKPFVSTRVGGIPEIADPSYSRLVAAGKVDELAEALQSMLQAPPTVDLARVREHNISWKESARLLGENLQRRVDERRPRNTIWARNESYGMNLSDSSVASSNSVAAIASLNGAIPNSGVNEVKTPSSSPFPRGREFARMRILAITNQYPRLGRDGIAPFNRQQFRALAQDHELRVVAPISWTDLVQEIVRLDMRSRHYQNRDQIWVDHPHYYYPPKIWQHRYGQYYLRSVRKWVRHILKEYRPEVLLGCWAHPDGWATVQIAREAGLPVVVKVHGSDILVAGQEPRRRERIAEGLREANGVVAVSQDLADHVIRLGVDPAKVHVVYNGVDADLFAPGNQATARRRLGIALEGKVILFVGNLLWSKGVGVLAEACGKLRGRGVAFRGYLVGQGRDESGLRAFINWWKLNDCLTIVGAQGQLRLADWYRACELVVLPSFSEGVPNVLREAMMCGKPFIATRVGGIPEIADPSYSRLVPPENVDELTNALQEMLQAPPVVDVDMVRRKSVTWEESAQLLASHLRAAVLGHRGLRDEAKVLATKDEAIGD